MSTMGERVKAIRTALGINQAELARSISITRASISKIEKDERNMSEQTKYSICREHNVNLTFLETGEGDMFLEMPTDLIDQIAQEYALDEFDKEIVLNYVKLPYEKRQAFKAYLKSVFENLND